MKLTKSILSVGLILFLISSCSVFDRPPEAHAGSNGTAYVGFRTLLDGSATYDPNEDSLTYVWSISGLPGDSALTNDSIENSTEETAAFTPDVIGTYIFLLTVRDSSGESDTATVSFQVSEPPVEAINSPGLILSELFMESIYIYLEFFNTTDEAIYLQNYSLVITEIDYSGSAEVHEILLTGADYISPGSYTVLTPYAHQIREGTPIITTSSFSYYDVDYGLSVEWIYSDPATGSSEHDFLQVNTEDLEPDYLYWPAGLIPQLDRGSLERDWSVTSAEQGSFTGDRSWSTAGSPYDQWSADLGTLGLPNDSSGNTFVEVTLW